MSFRIEIADLSLFTRRHTLTSSSSVSDESEDETAPFTTSPLDNCRGGQVASPVKYRRRKVRDAKRKAYAKNTKAASK
jgi:hypothetical protein